MPMGLDLKPQKHCERELTLAVSKVMAKREGMGQIGGAGDGQSHLLGG